MRIEIHAGDGGADAEAFATELASAATRFADGTTSRSGRVINVDGNQRL